MDRRHEQHLRWGNRFWSLRNQGWWFAVTVGGGLSVHDPHGRAAGALPKLSYDNLGEALERLNQMGAPQ